MKLKSKIFFNKLSYELFELFVTSIILYILKQTGEFILYS